MNTNITTIEECPLKKYNISFFFFYRNRFHENTVRRKNFFFWDTIVEFSKSQKIKHSSKANEFSKTKTTWHGHKIKK